MNRKVFIRLVIIAGGIGIILLSLFAFQLGLDNDPGWGPRRTQLIFLGLGVILFGSLYWLTPKFVGHAKRPLFRVFSVMNLEDRNIVGLKARPTNTLINNILLALLFFFTICIYIWIITIGRIDKWPSGRDYYWKLTQAFQHGQTYLLEEPNPELAKLENPYDHHQRKNIEYLWDTTYYNGKYFLYWGPIPAVIGVLVNAVTSRPVTDTGLVFSFVIGIALFSALILYEIYKKFQIPAWAFWCGVFVASFNVPLIWLLTRPTFYEVSISGGQFFLMAGFYFLFLGFRNSDIDQRWISASALTLGLAGATRINLLPSIIVLAFIAAWKIYAAKVNRRSGFEPDALLKFDTRRVENPPLREWFITKEKDFRKALPAFASLFLPLGLVAISLCWYNYARFGSIFEFGHRYQLTGPSLTADYADISSPKYILPNTFTYLFRLPKLSADFPFFTVPWIKENMWPAFIHLPEHYYYTEPVAGILFVIPLIGFAALLLARLFWLFINGDISQKQFVDAENLTNDSANLFSWFGFTLLAYVLIQLFVLLIFINSAMRYLADVAPALIVLCAMFVGYYVKAVDTNWLLRRAIAWLWVAASALTVIFGLLIGLTGDKNNFLNQNPALYYLLSEWFTR